jgi:hypothetical protein
MACSKGKREIAKVTGKAIDAGEKFGRFISLFVEGRSNSLSLKYGCNEFRI